MRAAVDTEEPGAVQHEDAVQYVAPVPRSGVFLRSAARAIRVSKPGFHPDFGR